MQALLEERGIDFGGFQDHSIGGGDQAMAIGYTELVGPMIKAIQELSGAVRGLEAENRVLADEIAALKTMRETPPA